MIHILDRTFARYITNEQIQENIEVLATQLNQDYAGKHPVMICILNGAFVFAADLTRKLSFQPEIIFARYASYDGMRTTGNVRELIGLTVNIQARDVILVEDIVDTGTTLYHVIPQILERGASTVRIAALLQKPSKLRAPIRVDYCAFSIPDEFIVGYGLDYNGMGRNYKDIYIAADQSPHNNKNTTHKQ